ncbi:hypothetical protein [Morganella morganii]|uniref:hypothetical protein n=1 Tax=Morganella morganii TaxID=582 RepID=UPI00388F00EF
MQFNNTINRKINKANISPDKVLFEKDPDIIQQMGNIIRFANKKRSVNIRDNFMKNKCEGIEKDSNGGKKDN